jgi:hypothetical protein
MNKLIGKKDMQSTVKRQFQKGGNAGPELAGTA